MTDGSLCAMGGLTPIRCMSALNHFPEDFQPRAAAVRRGRVRRRDHGPRSRRSTTARRSASREQTVTLTIDGTSVTVPAGTSVMAAAMHAGTQIPKLCATDSLEPFGSCRLCLVEIEGRRGTPASCTTPAETGMVVRTQTDKLAELRKGVMELYISDHPLDCLTCSANGDCELQDMAGAVGLREVRYGYDGANHVEPTSTVPAEGRVEPLLHLRPVQVHRLLPLRARLRGGAGHLRADDRRAAASTAACRRPADRLHGLRMRLLRRLRPGLPDRDADGEVGHRASASPSTPWSPPAPIAASAARSRPRCRATRVVRMVPYKDGKANEGHSCVKGRFAWGYATHKDRITKPMIRDKITDPWREVSWDEAIGHAASEFKRIQAKYGTDSIGGITSSRCTNEETYLVQKLVRAAFGNNNVDTCARVCHSPTGYGLKTTLGTSAGTQDFDSVAQADVILVIGANPTDGHPVFASRMKKRLREGAKLIVVDPRQHRPRAVAARQGGLPPAAAARHQRRGDQRDGARDRHRRPGRRGLRPRALRPRRLRGLGALRRRRAQFAGGARRPSPACRRPSCAPRRGSTPPAATAAIYYGLGVTEHSQGSTMVMGMANLAMATGNIGRAGVGVNPLRGQNNVQGSCDMGSFPHELPGYRHVSDDATREMFEALWGVPLDQRAGPAHPQHARRGGRRHASRASTSRARTSPSPIPTRSTSPPA